MTIAGLYPRLVEVSGGQDRQHRRAQHIPFARGIGAGQYQRTALHPGIKPAADL